MDIPTSISHFAAFADSLRRRGQEARWGVPALRRAVRRSPTADASSLERAADLLERSAAGLDEAETELRAQNDALLSARLDLDGTASEFRTLFDLAPAAYLVTTPDARITHVNGAACALLGRRTNALAGHALAGFVDRSDQDAFDVALARTRRSDLVEEWPVRLVPTDRPAVECRVHVRPLRAPDRGLTALCWIVTEAAGDILDSI